MIAYPEVADGIRQFGKGVATTVIHNDIRDPILKRAHIIEGMERLISAAYRLENRTESLSKSSS